MRRFHKNTQAPAVLRKDGLGKTTDLIKAIEEGNNSPTIDSLYRHPDVKRQLKSDQNEKCAYCERKLNGDYGAVEHYRPKGGWQQESGDSLNKPGYYWLAFEWSNLLFCCDECNTSYKMNLFPLANPDSRNIENRDISKEQPLLINPSTEDPGAYIAFNKEMAVPRVISGHFSEKGEKTIELLGLNSRSDLKQARRNSFFIYKNLLLFRKALEVLNVPQELRLLDRVIALLTNEDAEFTGMFLNQVSSDY